MTTSQTLLTTSVTCTLKFQYNLFYYTILSTNILAVARPVTMASTSSSDPLVFYDIASGPPVHPYAPNPCKVRYALNFKRANFVTKWTELSDVEATRKSLGLDPVRFFGNGEPFYTLPALKDPSTDKVVGDSFDIAVYLDKKHPDGPSLFRNSIGLYAAFNAHMDTIFTTGAALCAQSMPFNPETAEQDKAEFCRRIGVKTWDEILVRGEDRKKLLSAFQVALGDAAKCFRFSDGPFIGGKEADYADIIVGGWLMFLSQTLPEWDEVRTWHGGLWGKLHDSLEPYRGTW
jgi:glutathione S-transferase